MVVLLVMKSLGSVDPASIKPRSKRGPVSPTQSSNSNLLNLCSFRAVLRINFNTIAVLRVDMRFIDFLWRSAKLRCMAPKYRSEPKNFFAFFSCQSLLTSPLIVTSVPSTVMLDIVFLDARRALCLDCIAAVVTPDVCLDL